MIPCLCPENGRAWPFLNRKEKRLFNFFILEKTSVFRYTGWYVSRDSLEKPCA